MAHHPGLASRGLTGLRPWRGLLVPLVSGPMSANRLASSAMARSAPLADLPSTLVIAADGRIVGHTIGAVTYQGLDGMIRKAGAPVA